MIDFKKWLDYQEYFLNTDNLFVEVFDQINLNDVKVYHGTNNAIYQFKDNINGEDYSYKVSIYNESAIFDVRIANNFKISHSDLYSQFKIKYPKSFDVAEIELTITKPGQLDYSYKPSNLGNQNFVYSKMLACIQDVVSKRKPLFLKFEGYDDSMDLLYDRFIKMSSKFFPQDAYVSYLADNYIRKDVYDLIPNDSSLELAKKERENNLINTRISKNNARKNDFIHTGLAAVN